MVCTVCSEAITNPICPDCLAEQMISWLNEIKVDLDVVYDSALIFKGLETSGKCIKCNKDMTVCRHCFTREVYNGLVDKYPKLEEDFMRMWNYEIFDWDWKDSQEKMY